MMKGEETKRPPTSTEPTNSHAGTEAPKRQERVPLGQLVATPGALEAVPPEELAVAIERHARGDWGECCPDDAAENELALKEGFRLMSVYKTTAGIKFWVITEADRSVTTVLLPEEY